MKTECKLDNVDLSDHMLVSSLEGISSDIDYKIELNFDEINELLTLYIEDKLEINLKDYGMELDTQKDRLYFEDIYATTYVINELVKHFGKSVFVSDESFECTRYYTIKPDVLIRKIAKFGVGEFSTEGCEISYNCAYEFTQSWIYKYIKLKAEETE